LGNINNKMRRIYLFQLIDIVFMTS
jgi:hypothetical protein